MNTLRSALSLIRDVTAPSIAQHRLRSFLTLVGVVIGTQVVVAIALLNRSTLVSFEHTVETIAGRADLQVSNGSAGVPEDLVATLASIEGVSTAAGLIQGTLTTTAGDLTVFGVDLLGDQGIRETQFPKKHVHIKDGLRFTNAPDSVAISTPFADRAHLALGDSFTAGGPTGATQLTVRGLLDPIGPAALFGGSVGLVDLPTAQRLFNREGRYDQIDIALVDRTTTSTLSPRLTALVGGAGVVEAPRERGARLGSMLAGVQTVLTLVSLFAVIVGAFIIYHTMETAIAHRRHECALARALGYRRKALLTAIGIEALAYGTVGSAIGILLGAAAARLSLAVAATGVVGIWGRVDLTTLAVTPRDLVAAFGLGVTGALVASLAPAREAGRIRIVEQLHGESVEIPGGSKNWGATLKGLGFAVAGYLLLDSGIRPDGFNTRIALIMTGVVLLALSVTTVAPIILWSVAMAVRAAVRRAQPVGPVLATESILRNPSKSRGALAALMVAFAMVLIVGAFVRSLRGSILSWVDQTFSADLRVSPSTQLPLPSGPTLAKSMESELRAIPDVIEVRASRMINVRVGDEFAILRTSDGQAGREPSPVVEGDVKDTSGAFERGDVVYVSDNFAYRQRLRAGDELTLETPSGSKTFTIGAVVTDYTLDIGTIILAGEPYRRLWKDDLVNSFLVWLAPGSDVERVRMDLSQRLRPRFSVVISTSREFNAMIASALDSALLMTYAIQLVAIAIAVIGVVNFFLADLLDRRREIGLLRSVALSKRQLLGMLGVEASILGTLGGILAVLYAWPVSRLLITRSTRLVSGWALTFDFPMGMALAAVAIAALTSLAAAYYPARRAIATPVVDLVAVE